MSPDVLSVIRWQVGRELRHDALPHHLTSITALIAPVAGSVKRAKLVGT